MALCNRQEPAEAEKEGGEVGERGGGGAGGEGEAGSLTDGLTGRIVDLAGCC